MEDEILSDEPEGDLCPGSTISGAICWICGCTMSSSSTWARSWRKTKTVFREENLRYFRLFTARAERLQGHRWALCGTTPCSCGI